jgi:hypothetical protein
MPYYLTLALQAFCIYHAYKNKSETYWFFIIIFIPVIGGIIYLVTQVFNRKDIEVIQNELTTIINPSKKIKDLEDKLQFSETHQNRINLADEYLKIGDYNNAIIHYKKSLEGNFKEDFHAIEQIIKAYYKTEDFKKVLEYSKIINHKVNFKKSKAHFFYALSLEKLEYYDDAELELRKINQPYSNYVARLVLSKLLIS